MSGIKESERIEALRKRLYERGAPSIDRTKHTLTDTPQDVPTVWQRGGKAIASVKTTKEPEAVIPVPLARPVDQNSQSALRTIDNIPVPSITSTSMAATTPAVPPEAETSLLSMAPKKTRRSYRFKILAGGVGFFLLAMVVAIIIQFVGNNGISGENITLAVSGPFTIGGGEVMPIQVGLTNSNDVPIESATLIVEYPRGTLSANDEKKELFSERLPLETVAAGETINVPLRAIVFGEENQEQEIKVSVEYRVQGSNALFFKEADVLRYKISSSPIVITADTLKKVSAGQETEIKLTIKSNAQNPLSNVLVKAEYPLGFSYSSAEPAPTGGQNLWLLKTLDPEQSTTITIKGAVVGNATDEYAIHFTVGIPNERDQQSMASVFATAETQFEIEQPFIKIDLEIGGVKNGTAVVKPIERSSVSIDITNTLPDTIYDIVAEAVLSGNAISDLEVGPPNGFYDSAKRKVTWDISSAPELESLEPGQKARLTFAIAPSGDVAKTPEINVQVNIKARRVSESNVQETLTGTAEGTMKVASEPDLKGYVTYNSGIFSDTGPVPPKAEQKTTYTISLMVDNGTNDISGTTVTATLPSYVTWEDKTSGVGVFSYDKIKRTVSWNAGKVESNAVSVGSFQVSIIPSKSQLDSAPTLVGEQFMRADDLFTSTVVRDSNPAITTEILPEAGYPKGNGRVTE